MQRTILRVVAVVLAAYPVSAFAQAPKAATYITAEEIQKVNAIPTTDHTLRVVDIGNENLAVGVIHRGATAAAAAAAGRAAGAAPASGRAAAPAAGRAAAPATPAPACGEQAATPQPNTTAGGISHDSQTEGYVIISGGGTLVTGGHIVNGRRSLPEAEVTTTLNGPSCSGAIAGADVVKRVVKVGDVIIIPAGVPHGWIDITDHVDYLSIRPSDHILTAGYVHPAIK